MGLFGKKATSVKISDDRALVERNSKLVETLLAYSSNDEITEELKALREKLKYLIPTEDNKVHDLDKKITASIQDIKILFAKDNGGNMDGKIKDAIKELFVLIAERNSYV